MESFYLPNIEVTVNTWCSVFAVRGQTRVGDAPLKDLYSSDEMIKNGEKKWKQGEMKDYRWKGIGEDNKKKVMLEYNLSFV